MEENMINNNEKANSNEEDVKVNYLTPQSSDESTAKGVLIGAGIALVTVGGIKAVKLISKKLKDVFSKDEDEDEDEKPKKKSSKKKKSKKVKNVKHEEEESDEDEEDDDDEEEDEKSSKKKKSDEKTDED